MESSSRVQYIPKVHSLVCFSSIFSPSDSHAMRDLIQTVELPYRHIVHFENSTLSIEMTYAATEHLNPLSYLLKMRRLISVFSPC